MICNLATNNIPEEQVYIVNKSVFQLWKNHFSFFSNELKACNFIKKDTLAQVFSCEFWEPLRNSFFTEHLWWLLLNLMCDNTILAFIDWLIDLFIYLFIYLFIVDLQQIK